jgi:hypothetical protein
LEHIDSTLEALLRATVPISAQDVDVSFEPPDREWSAKLTRPTVNLFLWDLRRSTSRARTGMEEIERDGQVVRRAPFPRVELRYLVSVWTSDHGDERALLSGLMRAILAHEAIPATFVDGPLEGLPPLELLMARSGDEHPDIGAVLDGQLKPGISITVIAAVDTNVFTPAGPPVEVFDVRLGRRDVDAPSVFAVRRVAGEIADPAAVGVTVISPRGVATVNLAGRFVIPAVAGDELVIETDPPRTVAVPLEGGVRVS